MIILHIFVATFAAIWFIGFIYFGFVWGRLLKQSTGFIISKLRFIIGFFVAVFWPIIWGIILFYHLNR